MNERLGSFYNNLYSSEKIVFGGGKPEQIVTEIPRFIKEGKVLDIGGGEGRNAIFLAENGYDVEVIDLAEAGLLKVRALAEEKSLNNIRTREADIREGIQDSYEVIVSSFMLHHLKKEEAVRLIAEMQEHTRDGGVNAITSFMIGFQSPDRQDQFYPDSNELKNLYKDWDMHEYKEEERRTREIGEDGKYKMAKTAFLLAQKPNR